MNANHHKRIMLLAPDNERGHEVRNVLQHARADDQTVLANRSDDAFRKMGEKACEVAVVAGEEGLSFVESVTGLGLNVPVILIAPDEDGALVDKARLAGASDALLHSQLTPKALDDAIRHALLWRTEESPDARRERENKQAKLFGMENSDSLARFVSGIAHEIRNPLSLILLAADYVARPRPLTDESRAKIVSFLREGADRIDSIMSGMLGAYAAQQMVKSAHDVVEVIEEALSHVSSRLESLTGILVCKEYGKALPKVLVDRSRLVESVAHRLGNAIDAMPGGGRLNIRAYAYTFTSNERANWYREAWFEAGDTTVIIEISDTGALPADQSRHIYEQFFTTKPSEPAWLISLDNQCSAMILLEGISPERQIADDG